MFRIEIIWKNFERILNPVAELEKINRLGDTPIKEGQRLIVSDQEEGILMLLKQREHFSFLLNIIDLILMI